MTITQGDSAVHSAQTETAAPLGGANASPRAPAREYNECTAQPELHSAVTGRDWIGDAWAWIRDWITPPAVWTDGSEPLQREWEYACAGEQTTPDGLPRLAVQLYSLTIAMPIIGAAEYVKWIVRRPSRLAAALALLWYLAQFPPLSWLI